MVPIRQLSQWGCLENKVITFSQDAKTNTTGSTSSEFADSTHQTAALLTNWPSAQNKITIFCVNP